ncbi:aldo/keto reductase [Pseudotabrizicola sp. L79]|uniref:aldo/keto reductase n=1 Tax=Pseudotabrizicola sp. L79 TaxID=3118402 RepID=UPI002F956EE1
MTRLRLNDGNRIPKLGLGLWQIPADTASQAVSGAIARGYRLFDGAAMYGNEQGLGDGIRAGMQAGELARDQLFVTTKIWNDAQGHDATLRAFEACEARLGLLPDLVLIHWPCPARGLYVETWRALIRLRDEGRVRSVGVSNFLPDHLERIIGETGVTPVLNQIELHPRLQQAELRALHDRLGIVTQSWKPLGGGACFADPVVAAITARSGKTPAQVILRWHLQLGCSAIPRSARAEGQAENIDLFDFELTEAEMQAMAGLETGGRLGPDPVSFA